jgi:acylphosphatase
MEKSATGNILKCARVIVYGRVQGVGFRYFAQAAATRYGLVGWVRNRYDGSVEILAEGPENAFDAFIKVIKQGPSASHVQKIDIQWQTPLGKFHSFAIRT